MGSAVFEVLEIQSKFKIEQNKRLTPCLHEACILVAIGVFASPASLPMCRHCDAPLRSHDQAVMEVGPLILSCRSRCEREPAQWGTAASGSQVGSLLQLQVRRPAVSARGEGEGAMSW